MLDSDFYNKIFGLKAWFLILQFDSVENSLVPLVPNWQEFFNVVHYHCFWKVFTMVVKL